jgi:hypothetical protein
MAAHQSSEALACTIEHGVGGRLDDEHEEDGVAATEDVGDVVRDGGTDCDQGRQAFGRAVPRHERNSRAHEVERHGRAHEADADEPDGTRRLGSAHVTSLADRRMARRGSAASACRIWHQVVPS